jgi:flagellar hook-basal body complex protein FliE
MRAISATLEPPRHSQDPSQADFGKVLRQAMEKVNETQAEAKALVNKFESGASDANVAQVMVAMQKASISFQAMTEVRNRLVDAYREIMNMPI